MEVLLLGRCLIKILLFPELEGQQVLLVQTGQVFKIQLKNQSEEIKLKEIDYYKKN